MVREESRPESAASTRNSGSSWNTGNLVLTEDDLGAAALTMENIVPGRTGRQCIVVTSHSRVPGEVRVYTQNLVTSRGLEDRIFFDLEQGTGGSFNTCDGFKPTARTGPELPLSTLASVNCDFATGRTVWRTAGTPGEAQSYRCSWRFDTTGLSTDDINALQGACAGLDLIWELQPNEPPALP